MLKLIGLFARLMFSQGSHSLTDLARLPGCSKQTVLRLVGDIRRAYGVEIEETIQEKRKYYRLKKKAATPSLSLTPAEATVLPHMFQNENGAPGKNSEKSGMGPSC